MAEDALLREIEESCKIEAALARVFLRSIDAMGRNNRPEARIDAETAFADLIRHRKQHRCGRSARNSYDV